MPKTIGFETWEILSIGLINVTRCDTCEVLIHFNGLPPRFCSKGHEIRTKPVTPAGGFHGTPQAEEA